MTSQGLILSDMHVGSVYGLLPPSFCDVNGNRHDQNEGQEFLWSRYIHLLNRTADRSIDFIVINGDLLDGSQKKNNGKPLTLHRLDDQRAAALLVLHEIRKRFPKAIWYFVEGTPYHELGEEVEQVAVRLLRNSHFQGRDIVQRTLRLKCGEATIQFHHEVGYTGGLSKSSNLEKEILYDLIAAADHGWDRSDALIRSHCHYFRYVGRGNKLALVTPCWQLQTEYITKGSPAKNIPDIGGVVLTIDDSLIANGVCPVGFVEYLYRHPKPEVTIFKRMDVEECDERTTTNVA